MRTIGAVAALANVTVRTLRHFHEVGVVVPSARSAADYRLYNDDDLVTLHAVLFYRELGLALDEIVRIVHDPGYDRGAALEHQRLMLMQRRDTLDQMIAAVDAALDSHTTGRPMTESAMFAVFGEQQRVLPAEAEQRWATTDAWAESARRTGHFTRADGQHVKSESQRLTGDIAAVYTAGLAPDSDEAMDAVEAHRQQIDQRFSPCTHAMHVQLGEMYVSDPRFRATCEQVAAGLVQGVRDVIVANAARAA
ncbi:MAG: MerR family transcriptional regulator [Nitriliruptoraceae bacterium]